MLPARLATCAVAVVLCAWFVLSARQAHDVNQAESIISAASRLSPGQAAHVDSLLHAAGNLNPDQQVNLLRGEVATLENRPALAARIFQRVADREPLNVNAWLLVAQADFGKGRPLKTALSHIAELFHQVPASR